MFERYSDSSSSFITLDSNNPSVYKQLYRAAKAKQKLKIRVTVSDKPDAKPIEVAKPGTIVPDHLPTRCYVHPYISDPVKNENETSLSPVTSPLEDRKTLSYRQKASSSTTLVPFIKTESDVQNSEVEDNMANAPKPYYWAISESAGFSEATQGIFEKNLVPTDTSEDYHEKEFEDEAPVPRFFSAKKDFLTEHANITQKLDSLRHATARNFSAPKTSFSICCNKCERTIPDAHWHCNICDRGDFDLCKDCIDQGYLCESAEHWLIKRTVKDGKVINSTTHRIGPKKATASEDENAIPGAFTSDIKREDTREPLDFSSRTCNSCVGGESNPFLCYSSVLNLCSV